MTNPEKPSTSVPWIVRQRIGTSALAAGLFASTLVFSQSATPPAKPATTKPATPTSGAQTTTTAKPAPAPKPPVGARAFATTKEAADALIQAAAASDEATLLAIFGADNKDLVETGDEVRDKSYVEAFSKLAKEAQRVVVNPSNASLATLEVGNDRWPLPVPLVKVAGKWYFDAAAGREEVLRRRIGGNELDAIEVCRGFVEAQKEYALTKHDDSKVHQYAQRIISTPGKHDGLYWKNADGTDGGPIGEAVAKAIQEGYELKSPSAYHGYMFRVLKGQGAAAPLGEMDYMIGDAMIGGFALLATPAEYGVTGIQAFMVSYNGIVYQKDLGKDTVELAKKIDRYNPDKTWKRTDDGWGK